jgi:hypothetical protein
MLAHEINFISSESLCPGLELAGKTCAVSTLVAVLSGGHGGTRHSRSER